MTINFMDIYTILFIGFLASCFLAYLDYRTRNSEWPKSEKKRILLRTFLFWISPVMILFLLGHPKKRVLEKTHLWYLFIGYAIIFLILFFTVFFINKKDYLHQPEYMGENEEVSEKLEDKTADWKTYRNEEYGFEIKHPGDVDFDSIDYADPDDLRRHNIDPEYSVGSLLLIAKFNFANESRLVCASYEIEVRKTNYLDINNWVEDKRQRIEIPSDYEGTMISGKLSSVEDIEIQDKVAKMITIEGGFPFWSAQFGVINNGKLYTINYLDMSSYERSGCFEGDVEQGKAKYKNIFDKLISTFKFLE